MACWVGLSVIDSPAPCFLWRIKEEEKEEEHEDEEEEEEKEEGEEE